MSTAIVSISTDVPLADTLRINTATAANTDAADTDAELSAQDASQTLSGDKVSISMQGRALAAEGEAEKTKQEEEEESEADRIIRQLKQQIKKLEEEIKELEESDLPEKQKRQKIQSKQQMLMQYRTQLAKALKAKMKSIGANPSGGTDAEGVAGSLT